MSLITAYFKKETTSVDAVLSEVSQDTSSDASKIQCPESVNHSVDLLLDEDSNLKAPGPPKRMKIALFAAPETSMDLTADCIRNHEVPVEQRDKLQDTLSTPEETTITTANTEDNELQEQVTAQLPKQQSRQTTLKFENGKCVLVAMEPITGMEVASQESSQVDSTTEDEYHPKKQQAKAKKKKSKRKNSNDENFVKEVEPSVTKKRSRKAAKKATKQSSEEAVSPHRCTLSKLTSEDDQVKLLPEILIVDSDNVEEGLSTLDKDSNTEMTVEPSVTFVEKEMVVGDSSDSDVICLTPRSASPLSQEEIEQPRSRPSTPAKNKWSHIFGIKSPQKKSPSRKSSPRKFSPKRSLHSKQVPMALSSLATSHEHYTLGIPLFHHILQQDDSPLWALPTVDLSSINADLTTLSCCQPHTAGASQDLSRSLISAGSDIERNPLHLKVRILLFY